MAPDCGPWSVSGNQRPAELRLQDRLHDQVALRGVQWLAEEQAKNGRVYNIEQPLGSAMWIKGNKTKQRIDQCMHGAQDEFNNPVQKATGFGSNMKWKKTTLRCSGHQGKPHSHLQGQTQGMARTAMAAVLRPASRRAVYHIPSSWHMIPQDQY